MCAQRAFNLCEHRTVLKERYYFNPDNEFPKTLYILYDFENLTYLSVIIPHPLLLSRFGILIFDIPSKIFTEGIVETLPFAKANVETVLSAYFQYILDIHALTYLSAEGIRICFEIIN